MAWDILNTQKGQHPMTNTAAQSLQHMDTNTTPKITYLKDYEPPHYWVETVDLTFDLYEDYTDVKSRITFNRNTSIATEAMPLVLQGEELELKSIALDDKSLSESQYHLTPETLTLPTVPQTFTLTLTNRIYPHTNTALSGLFRSQSLFCTQCEAEGFRRITFFPDRPDIMAKFTTTIYADKNRYPVLLSNGNYIAQGTEQNRHWVKWEDPSKKPCYLFALVAGNLVAFEDHFVTASGRLVTLKIYVEWDHHDQCAHAMQALKKAMKWDEETYGREYDLDIYMIVAVNDFNMGAMENKGLNIFNARYILARPETATDTDFQNIDAVVGHEYFHNWSGNRVTCRDWFQLSLKEGLTVFREHHFSADIEQSPVNLISHVRALRGHQFSEDAGPLAHPVRPDAYVEINNFYTSTVYEKGAEVIRMLQSLLGRHTFRKGMDLYFERYDGQAVTTDDFVSTMEAVSGQDFTQFKLWYSQAGTPEIEVTEHHDPATHVYQLTLAQHCPKTPNQPIKQAMHIPIAVGLLDSQGTDLLKENVILSLKEPQQTFTFPNLPEKPILSILRGFSAPVKIQSPLSNAELAFLLAHDSDDFNRWDAGQTLSERLILSQVPAVQQGKMPEIDPAWLSAQHAVLKDPTLNRALKVAILSLPATPYLLDKMTVADIDALMTVKQFLISQLSKTAQSTLLELYHGNTRSGRYQYAPEAVEQRALKNLCLSYLAKIVEPSVIALCMQQWKTANNMTDAFAVLSILCDIDCPERTQLLNEFYDHWQHDPLVVNKWLRAQAMSDLPNALEIVQELMEHPAFDITNPNKVYSLIGGFSSGNLLQFHAKTGHGYTFLANFIIQLDTLNPQVAARMMNPFTRWRRFDLHRQSKMRAQLERIQSTPNLSKDVFEIVNKCLK